MKQRNPETAVPHCAEFIIGRRFAPTRWLHAGYKSKIAAAPQYERGRSSTCSAR